MSVSRLLTRNATITHRYPSATVDGYGNPLSDESTSSVLCELQQRQRSEETVMGELAQRTWLLVLPAGTSVDATDTVTVDDLDYELVGEPWPVHNPRTGSVSHIEATVKRTTSSEVLS